MTERTTLEAWGADLGKAVRNSGNPIEAITTLPMPPDRTEVKVTKTTTTTPHKTVIDYRTERVAEETDPNGKSLNEPGAKGDAGKLLPALVLGDFARALIQVAEVGTYGAKKYTAHGWLTVPNGIERYEEAMMRHWLKEKAGEDTDPDTGLLHLSHICWNVLAILELTLRGKND